MDDGLYHVMNADGSKRTICGLVHTGYGKAGEGVATAAIMFRDHRDGDRHMDGYRPLCNHCASVACRPIGGVYRTDCRILG